MSSLLDDGTLNETLVPPFLIHQHLVAVRESDRLTVLMASS